jgi:hypothetical protein
VNTITCLFIFRRAIVSVGSDVGSTCRSSRAIPGAKMVV